MNFPAVDLGIMAEHLPTHEGVISKLKIFKDIVDNQEIKKLLQLNIQMLREHVRAMLELIDPDHNGEVKLAELPDMDLNTEMLNLSEQEKDIVLEARAASKLMGSDNFNSALMMKDMNVKNIHIQMAYQDVRMQVLYNMVVEHVNGDFTPHVTEAMQSKTYEKYKHILKE
ncbi:hypothetical protein [Mesobacillus selenatarsenatis]|uniref:Uncharacterized protein n=1 Tax=Mesobacillus selenatarsenatis TaxID=388741 RepID=A0A846TLH8_9BACI|nr:hypothetical protein [Mesobacillus selenatarsenatis]NKE06472.1 hypothetical protein [Mesobacillus selenatarsenatis]